MLMLSFASLNLYPATTMKALTTFKPEGKVIAGILNCAGLSGLGLPSVSNVPNLSYQATVRLPDTLLRPPPPKRSRANLSNM